MPRPMPREAPVMRATEFMRGSGCLRYDAEWPAARLGRRSHARQHSGSRKKKKIILTIRAWCSIFQPVIELERICMTRFPILLTALLAFTANAQSQSSDE